MTALNQTNNRDLLDFIGETVAGLSSEKHVKGWHHEMSDPQFVRCWCGDGELRLALPRLIALHRAVVRERNVLHKRLKEELRALEAVKAAAELTVTAIKIDDSESKYRIARAGKQLREVLAVVAR